MRNKKKEFRKTHSFDDDMMNYLSAYLKEELEKEYKVSYDELCLLEESEQDKIIDNSNKIKKFTKK